MTNHFTSRTLFEELNGHRFPTYRDLEITLRGKFASHVERFPGQYSVDRLLDLGERSGWIVQLPNGEYEIKFVKGSYRAKRVAV